MIFKKRSIYIEAWQFNASNLKEATEFANQIGLNQPISFGRKNNRTGLIFKDQLIGIELVTEIGDYVIKTKDGKFSMRTKNSFEKEYEEND